MSYFSSRIVLMVENWLKCKTLTDPDNLFIFESEVTREEVLTVLRKVPEDIYELFEVEDAPEDQCDYMAASGRCFNRKAR